MIITKITDLVHWILPAYVKSGDCVVDATLGNGLDTLFLRKQVGDHGKVYAFDIQARAIDRAKATIPLEIQSNICFLLDDHKNIDKYLDTKVQAFVFNLGYLPSSDHDIKTSWDSTEQALNHALELLDTNGVISVAVYLSHDEGMEYRNLRKWMKGLNPKKNKVIEIDPVNQREDSPKLFICQKMEQ